MNFSMRRATPDDAEFIVALFSQPHVAGQMHAPSRDEVVRSLARPGIENYVVERDAAPFGNMLLDTGESWLTTFRSLAVMEPGGGAGTFALTFALKRAFDELRAHRVFLEVLESNVLARRLYERLGFRNEGLYRDGFRDAAGRFHNLVPYGMLACDRASCETRAPQGDG
jgi:GNAT superfamily N-acetyltransferase